MKKKGFKTRSIHEGELKDSVYKGAISPIYLGTVYDYLGDEQMKYPRYFNTPNQLSLSKKIASLELELQRFFQLCFLLLSQEIMLYSSLHCMEEQ